jgi:hypothetical protein
MLEAISEFRDSDLVSISRQQQKMNFVTKSERMIQSNMGHHISQRLENPRNISDL